MQKLENYDMRRFGIKDLKDVYAFLDMAEKAAPKIKQIIKQIQSKNVAQANIIRNRDKKLAELPTRMDTAKTVTEETIQQVTPENASLEFEKEAILAQLRKANEKQKEVAKEIEANLSPEERLRVGVDPSVEVVSETFVQKGDYGIRIMRNRNGGTRSQWTFNGIVTKTASVPSNIKTQLTEALSQVTKNAAQMKEESISSKLDDIIDESVDAQEELDNADSSVEQ